MVDSVWQILYILIVIVLMMATGTTDPVREATVETWDVTRPGLTIPNSDPDGDETKSWCQTQTDGHACLDYYAAAIITANCQMGPGYSRMQILNNCSKALDDDSLMGTGDNTGCASLHPLCTACDEACMEAQIQEVKDNLEPASLFVLILIAYLFVTVVWNNIMVHGDDDIGDAAKMVGLILNGALLALSFILMIMGGVGAFKADDACPQATDGCVPTSMIMITLIGLALMVVSGLIVAGIQLSMNLLVSLSTAIMVFLMVFMVLFGLILGMSTGLVMDDMTYYYDTQYPKLRSALEKADNSYCQMTREQCSTVVTCAGNDNLGAASTACTVTVQTDDYGTDVTDDDDNVVTMTFASMWKGMFAAAAQEAASTNDDGTSNAPAWLEHCATTGICIYCQDVLTPLEDADPNVAGVQAMYVWDNTVTDPDPTTTFNPLIGEPCTYADYDPDGNSAGTTSCVVQAPNVVWSWGLTGAVFTEGSEAPNVAGTWADSNPKWEAIGNTAGLASLPADMPLTATSLKCQGVQAIGFEADPDDVDGNEDCIAPFTTDSDENEALAFVRCSTETVGEMNTRFDAASFVEADPCPDTTKPQLRVESVDSWTSKVLNYTYYHNTAQVNLPYCEEAITDYVAVDQHCIDYADISNEEMKDSYYANCDNCNNPFAPFLFVQPGPESGYRQCLNFVVGHVEDYCQANADSECLTAINAAPTQLNFMLDAAFGDSNSGFCGYSDDGCKAKIKYDIEDSMQLIGILGAIFMGFFTAVIYCTLAAIKYYKGGGDDDDDDDDDDSDE